MRRDKEVMSASRMMPRLSKRESRQSLLNMRMEKGRAKRLGPVHGWSKDSISRQTGCFVASGSLRGASANEKIVCEFVWDSC